MVLGGWRFVGQVTSRRINWEIVSPIRARATKLRCMGEPEDSVYPVQSSERIVRPQQARAGRSS